MRSLALTLIFALACCLSHGALVCFDMTKTPCSRSSFDPTTGAFDTIELDPNARRANVARCKLTGYSISTIKDQPANESDKFEVTDRLSPYFGKCCWKSSSVRHRNALYYCETIKPGVLSKSNQKQFEWVASWAPFQSDQNDGFIKSVVTTAFRFPLHVDESKLDDEMLNDESYKLLKNTIEVKAEMTEMPADDHMNVLKQRLYVIQSTTSYDEIKHQAGLLYELLETAETIPMELLDFDFLKHVTSCIGNLHFADKTREFIATNKGGLARVVSGVGDHFFAESFFGEDKNYFNAFGFNPHQVIGHSDPHAQVSWVKLVGPRLGKAEADRFQKKPVDLANSHAKYDNIRKLLIQTLTLDMSAWARLFQPNMQVVPLGKNVDLVYGFVMEEIDAMALDHNTLMAKFG